MAGMAAGRFDPLMASARGAEILTSEAALSTAQSALNEAQDVEASALAASRLASARSDVACVEAKRARRREIRAAEERWLLAVGERRAAERAE
ncbi:hypothetical protein [Sphingomonas sanxanigenens]|uniref:hypothetical protein n=1 Tax=Sphingomonas sanxanigenens TaxID=397260 RepID=UPI0004BBCA9A|nr:hypothetical protein [Sphingomonas sanxanigenens]